jgi:hypothetical protein
VAFLGADTVARLLGLPEGVHVIGIREDWLRNGIMVGLESESFDPVPENAEPPNYTGGIITDPRRAQRAEARGWGPDYSDIDVQCPERDCAWERKWEDAVSLAEITRVVGEHLAEAHPTP